ncbi:MAG: hypothetical protein AB1898_19805 [Acidobacteriota bacterium]
MNRNVKPMPTLSVAPFAAQVPLLPVIEQAKSLLENESVAYASGTRRRPAKRQIKLALADVTTGEVRVVSGVHSGGKLTLDDSEIRFEVEWWNGFNSAINILEPANTAVVAMLYSIDAQHQRALGQDAIIYTPYSSALLQSELIDAGKNHLMDKILRAREELKSVPSRALPGTSLAESGVFTDQDFFNIILTEQMDPGQFRQIVGWSIELNEQQITDLMRLAERILVIVGANQDDAYRFTGNYARARGLTQFTPTGMRVVWSQYPDAGISRNFMEATSDQVSAIKAQICLMDSYLAEAAARHSALMGSGLERYAAGAAYNGGPGRVGYGLERFGLNWLHPVIRLNELQGKASLTRNELLELRWLKRNRSHETFVYLNKLRAIEQAQGERVVGSASLPASRDSAYDQLGR